jgi:hypothetical protein
MRPPESESFDSERNLSAHVSIVMSALGSKSDLGARSCEVRFTSMNGHRRAAGHVRKVPSGDMAAAAKPALRLPIVPAWLAGTFAHEGAGGSPVRRRFGLLTRSDFSLICLTATNTPPLELRPSTRHSVTPARQADARSTRQRMVASINVTAILNLNTSCPLREHAARC